MSNLSNRPFHVVVWGATGFTGQLVCRHIAENYQGSLKWAMAGRDKAKLESIRESISVVNPDCKDVPIVLAQLNDETSLDAMVSQTRVLLSTVGPYMRYGTPIVESCVRNSTHYCDVTGETPWVKQMILKHHEAAQKANAKIINSCGFDSIPYDLGVYYLVQHAREKYNCGLSQVQAILQNARGGVSGGTLESGFNMFSTLSKNERSKFQGDGLYLVPEELRGGRSKKADNPILRYLKEAKVYGGISIMAIPNMHITYRSYFLNGFNYGEDFKYLEAHKVANYIMGLLHVGFLSILLGAISMPFLGPTIRKTFLPSPGQGPSWDVMRNGRFQVRFVGVLEGNKELKTVEALVGDDHRDPGYLGTSRYLLESALCLALQEDELKEGGYPSGGVLTPASAMGSVLIKRLQDANHYFKITKP